MKQLALIALALVLTSSAFAEDKAQPQMTDQQKEMMAKFMAASTPGEQHKMLAGLEGTWKTKSKMWESPKAKPEQSEGTSTMKMILGGRWLQQEFKGQAMGQPYEGFGLIGYDNAKAEYVTVWIDNMSTAPVSGKGQFEQKSKTIKEKGTYTCPIRESHSQDYRSEWNLSGKNKMVYSMYSKGPVGDTEFKMMEITYTR